MSCLPALHLSPDASVFVQGLLTTLCRDSMPVDCLPHFQHLELPIQACHLVWVGWQGSKSGLHVVCIDLVQANTILALLYWNITDTIAAG